ncbi:TMEM165/GDT1 family protein [Halopenitus sp. H-Gu1]|uniref:TMEM165/GDT1 family protein n=1 Tax=Halopenitus sp. H-Gu1 TaxID=3242697 RepID=UPI00359D115E
MTGWLEIATIAFLAQLAVLPGEKVQFIIAALSTRYNPVTVVAAAGSAFAGWTVLEIYFGSYIQTVLPEIYLDVLTGILFLFFAIALFRSAPSNEGPDAQSDGGVSRILQGELDVRVPYLDWQVPNVMGGFLPIFALMAFGEFGDKTQLVTIGLAAQYPAYPTAIWMGEMAAIIPVSLLNAFVFFRFANRFDLRKAHFLAAAAFGFFGIDTLQATLTGVSLWEAAIGTVASALLAIVG